MEEVCFRPAPVAVSTRAGCRCHGRPSNEQVVVATFNGLDLLILESRVRGPTSPGPARRIWERSDTLLAIDDCLGLLGHLLLSNLLD